MGVGFWIALPLHPTGLSTTEAVWPRRTPFTEFSNNKAHSNSSTGMNIDDGPNPDGTTAVTYYDPRVDPTNGGSAASGDDVRSLHGVQESRSRGVDARCEPAALARAARRQRHRRDVRRERDLPAGRSDHWREREQRDDARDVSRFAATSSTTVAWGRSACSS